MAKTAKSLEVRWRERIIEDASGCYLWNGAKGKDGANTIHINLGQGKHLNMKAAKATWLIFRGEVPLGKIVGQTCGNPDCCRLEHLELTTRSARTGRPARDNLDRFVEQIQGQREPDGAPPIQNPCWDWIGLRMKTGYGRFKWHFQRGIRKMTTAHRAAYWLFVGEVPADLTIDHICNRPCCANPNHLRILPISENAGWTNRHKKKCKRGHAFTKANTYVTKIGGRVCKECKRAYARAWYRANGRKKT